MDTMVATFPLHIISKQEKVYEGTIESLVVPGKLGYLGVLAHHAPLLTSLKEGTVTIRDAQNDTSQYRVQGGFLEVSTSQVVILADQIEKIVQS